MRQFVAELAPDSRFSQNGGSCDKQKGIRMYQTVTRLWFALLVTGLVAVLTGCRETQVKQLAYEVGHQQACLAANENRFDETNRDSRCISGLSVAPHTYEQYAAEREAFNHYMNDLDLLNSKLEEGEAKAREVAVKVLDRVKTTVGFA